MENQERRAALLTQAQRGLIRGEKSYSQASEREIRKRIRHRMYNSVLDLALIAREFPVEQTQKVFTNPPDNTLDTPHIREKFPTVLRLFFRGIIADYPDRSIETIEDLTAVLEPVIENFEEGIELYLTQNRHVRADFEISPEISKVQTLEGVINELELRRSPVTGRERLKTEEFLASAGLGEERITELLGTVPDEDGDGDESEFSLEELAAMPNEQLAVLLDSERITVEEQIAALEEKYGEE
jgi:hypothetical protein